LVGGLGPGPPAPPLKSGPDHHHHRRTLSVYHLNQLRCNGDNNRGEFTDLTFSEFGGVR